MGEPPNQVDVTLSRGLWLSKYEVTQGQYQRVMNSNSSAFPHFWGDSPAEVDVERLPVEMVSWDNAVEFCRVLTEQEQKAGRLPTAWEYRLPTEAQWEYACRAGTKTAYSFGDDESRLVDFAWYDKNSENRTHEAGQKLPNAWGLHDMHGNVWEWCRDWYQDKLLGGTDPEAPDRASPRVFRGGGWSNTGRYCQSAYRRGYSPVYRFNSLGFRVALVQQVEPGERSESK
jgi:formylglycine-generating enzyme required for sulfatase activity